MQGGELPFLAAYLDASNALRENPETEKQVPPCPAKRPVLPPPHVGLARTVCGVDGPRGVMPARVSGRFVTHAMSCAAVRAQVTFTFTLRRTLDPTESPLCRKEATFTFKKETDNRGWRECIPPSATENDSRLYLTVEVPARPHPATPTPPALRCGCDGVGRR